MVDAPPMPERKGPWDDPGYGDPKRCTCGSCKDKRAEMTPAPPMPSEEDPDVQGVNAKNRTTLWIGPEIERLTAANAALREEIRHLTEERNALRGSQPVDVALLADTVRELREENERLKNLLDTIFQGK